MTVNAQFFQEMIDALWTHLSKDTRYAALGLTEFRLSDGNSLPVQDDGRIESRRLPAIFVETIRPEVLERRVEPYREEVQIGLSMGVIYANKASHQAHSMMTAAAALMTIIDVIANRQAQSGRLGAPGIISSYSWELGDVEPIIPEGSTEVSYWIASFTVTLRRTRQVPAL
ncbi:MAG TPA: hypothetical protein ENK43_04390 [Planctomycetes bacterium]|nr:hypothetical protein [Planctomycetota bacterium]